jgi:Domain of unknown function (DUF4116)
MYEAETLMKKIANFNANRAHTESRILRQDPDGFTIAVPLTEFAAKWWGEGAKWHTFSYAGAPFTEWHKEAPFIIMVIPELGKRGKFQMWASNEAVIFVDAMGKTITRRLAEENWNRFKEVIRLVGHYGMALGWVPYDLRTPELCRTAVAQAGSALRSVPVDLRTLDLHEIAVAQYGEALRWVPSNLCTPELCMTAVGQAGEALEYVPDRLVTAELCRIAVEQDGNALRWIPENLVTAELCRIAVEQDGYALRFVPDHLRADMAPFAKPEKAPQDTPIWDISLLDRLEQALQPSIEEPQPRMI